MKAFMDAKTLYGSVTSCRVYNCDLDEYVTVDIYTNVVTDDLIFASMFRTPIGFFSIIFVFYFDSFPLFIFFSSN